MGVEVPQGGGGIGGGGGDGGDDSSRDNSLVVPMPKNSHLDQTIDSNNLNSSRRASARPALVRTVLKNTNEC